MNHQRHIARTLIILVGLVVTATVSNAEWPLDEKLRQLKQRGYELVATVEGTDIPIRTPEDFKALPETPAPEFTLVDLKTGKEQPIVMEKGLESWGKALWKGLCDALGMEPHCNGFFK